MKKYLTTFLLAFSFSFANAQQIEGLWNGTLKIPGGQIDVIFTITQKDNVYRASMDIPAQNVKGLAASSVLLNEKKVTISLDLIGSVYVGEVTNDSTLNGEWKQNGMKLPLVLTKGLAVKTASNRTQTPKAPFPYEEREVTFENKKAGISLSGTLTVPNGNGKFPAVILVSGSGPQNRDSEIFGHKPFAVLADYLGRNGIAVLRYDERGVGKSGGDFSKATTYDFAEDAAAAIEFLKKEPKADINKIGLIGHSEGGLVGPIVATSDKRPSFLVLLAAPAVNIDELMLEQARLTSEIRGASQEMIKLQVETNAKAFALIKSGPITDTVMREVEDVFVSQLTVLAKGTMSEDAIRKQAQQVTRQTFTPWFVEFIKWRPKENLEKLSGPVLALYGSRDLQVSAKQNLPALREILTKNPKVQLTIEELQGLNHLFQTAPTGNIAEYGKIEETFSPIALKKIADWILLR
ncbi:MAG: hypothetical protein BGO21_32285 [Dyadobacter sp. 50-39]|uniref:alpha/beta hydrolase family protein n=1 Tax=Dyadobacter sp. 50-39 TaxID=1895756 RepID=UPI0009626E1B|nr:alpha/beta fold hydrolase [Dyadobacter sp. 50-39]OJV15654.1 MAG: hypothetical protein BGO21_32285 [Dyadobacter sp. 50-39]